MEYPDMLHTRITYHGDPVHVNSFTVRYPINTVATITCDDIYYLDGPTNITCQVNGAWNHQKPNFCIGKAKDLNL